MKIHASLLQGFLLCVLLAAGGCVSTEMPEPLTRVASGKVLDGALFGVTAADRPPELNLLEINDDMRAFLRENVSETASPSTKVRQILHAILDEGLYLRYDSLLTLSAEEAFYTRSGNCMSFTNLFIALAREVGLRARYQEVKVPPNWTSGSSAWFYNLHVNIRVDFPAAEQIVDFNLADYDNSYPRRALKDREGEALHHNNLGVHWMTEGDPRLAFLHYRRAIELRPGTGHFYTNLGTLYRREGHLAHAEAAFRRAIELSREPVAMSNLARLYEAEGRPDLAAHFETQINIFRRKNPYYLFHLAEEAYAAADYGEAKTLLRTAVRLHPDDERFHHLLAMVHVQQGDVKSARRRLRQAAELAEGDDRERFSQKLELLAGGQLTPVLAQ